MSPASRSKAKDKSSSARAAKEQQKASSKPATPITTGNGITSSAYNPISGTFHTIEAAPTASSPPPHNNGRFQNIDDTDDHSGSSLGTGAEYDSVSNNDSCSGESEDQKEKTATTTVRQEAIPGSDNDKRDKIRLKNERKHQRQREKRAQELHERCRGYLMSRKLEALAQQLVSMGFSSERATMALILNEGRIEESVAWLFEGGEEAIQHKDSDLNGGGNLKIDITEELNRIADMEIRYKCSRQEVERAIVACEGDLDKAAGTLKVAQKQEPPPPSLPKAEAICDLPTVGSNGKLSVTVTQNPMRPQPKTNTSVTVTTIQQRRDERDFNYAKAAPTVVASSPESTNLKTANLQSLRRIQPKSAEWARSQVASITVEKKWPSAGSSPVSYSLASPLQAAPPPPAKAEARYVEIKNLQSGPLREPVVMMQRPQSINAKPPPPNPPATNMSASPPGTVGWYTNTSSGIEIMKTKGGVSQVSSPIPNNMSSQQFYHQPHYQPFVSSPVDSTGHAAGWGGSWSTTGSSSSSSLAVPSSLGLFSALGSMGGSGSSSPVDWNTGGPIPQCDYTSIDWSLESTLSTRPSGLLMGLASIVKNGQMYDSWSSSTISVGTKSGMRSVSSNGVCNVGLQDGAVLETTTSASNSEGGSHEWTSPFAGKDIFSVPRQFVTSPSL